jgi:hypothetical protein
MVTKRWQWHENGNLYTSKGTYHVGEHACEIACDHNDELSPRIGLLEENSFNHYWTMKGSRHYSSSHEETARLAFEAGWNARKRAELESHYGTHPNLYMAYPTREGWPGDGSGEDDFADYNANEVDDYRDE